jgi:hypothetical protein
VTFFTQIRRILLNLFSRGIAPKLTIVSLYKALLFLTLAEAIKAGAVNLKHSYKYRALDDYLLPKAAWTAQRAEYLQRADLLGVADCQQTIHELAARLAQQYHHTNQRIAQGANPHLHFHKDGSFHVSTPAAEADESESLRSLLPAERISRWWKCSRPSTGSPGFWRPSSRGT